MPLYIDALATKMEDEQKWVSIKKVYLFFFYTILFPYLRQEVLQVQENKNIHCN
jgi:hypothetical protein